MNNTQTTAEIISDLMGNDGLKWGIPDGQTGLLDLVRRHGGRAVLEQNGVTRHQFDDGSAIVIDPQSGWDVGFDHCDCACFESGVTHSQDCLMDQE